MFHVELWNNVEDVVAYADIDVEEITLEDIAAFNWVICNGDTIHITED